MASPPPTHRPLPHFTTAHVRPTRPPLPPTSSSLAASSRPARKESLKRDGRPSQGIAMDGRGAYLEAALENRRLHGVRGPVLRERQPDEQGRDTGKGELEQRGDAGQYNEAYDGEVGVVGAWEDQQQDGGGQEVLSSPTEPTPAPPGGADLSRWNSTRRYMAELDDDDDLEALQEGDNRSTWHSEAWGSEARDSVATLEPKTYAPPVGRGAGKVPRESTASAVSVDPFSYSVYASLPSPSDAAFPANAAEPLPPPPVAGPSQVSAARPPTLQPPPPSSSSGPVVRIGPPSPTASSFAPEPHSSAIWREVTDAVGASPAYLNRSAPPSSSPPANTTPLAPPPPLSASTGRVRSQTFSSQKNFSRPFAPPPPPAQAASTSSPPPPARTYNAASRPTPAHAGSGDSYLDRSSSLGHASSVERSSSLGHSSQSHGGDSLSQSWEDRQRHGFRQHEEAKRAIALARSKSQRVRAERVDEVGVEELKDEPERVVPPLPGGSWNPSAHSASESTSSIHFPTQSPPPAPPHTAFSAHFSLSYYRDDEDDQDAQYALAPPTRKGSLGPNSPLSNPRAPPTPPSAPHSDLLAASPSFAHAPLSSSPRSPPSAPPSPPRQRNVLRKPRPEGRRPSDASSQPMARSPSAASNVSTSSTGSGMFSRFRARSKSRSGADERPDPAELRPPLPAISRPMLHHSTSTPPPLPSAPAPLLAHSLPSSAAPLSTAEFARLAASRPAFLRSKTSATTVSGHTAGVGGGAAGSADWVLKNVSGARTVQAGLTAGGEIPVARGFVVRPGDGEEMEHLSEAGSPVRARHAAPGMMRSQSDRGPAPPSPLFAQHGAHERTGSGAAPSVYSQYSYYDLPPDSPAVPSPSPTRSLAPSPSPLTRQSPLSPSQLQHAAVAAVKFADSPSSGNGGGSCNLSRASSTMEKMGFAARDGRTQSALMERTKSGREVRREPTSADDFLQVGIDLHENGELERAAWCFEQSAKRGGGCGAGMLMYGLTLRHGWGCAVNAQLGFRYIQMAAESVVEDLDRVVFGGRTLTEAEANTKAAKSELVLALHEMGVSYRFGWGVVKDKKMAVQYFTLAANLGDIDAQLDLAFALSNGKGCKKDMKLAAKYYRMAIAQGASDFGLSWVKKPKYD
ncbi:hypothetical protein JCM8097_004888 [Rhodosporidiobolus ruineniae]